MIISFAQLPLGARFEFRGRRYEKLALSFACDEECCGNVFQAHTEVFWDRLSPHAQRCPAPRQLSPRSPGRRHPGHACA